MADALVSSILEQITTVVAQQVQEEVKLVVGVTKEIDKLTSNLRSIQLVLSDAERRQLKDDAVRNWISNLKEVSYDMEDVLEEWSTAILKWKMDEAENARVPKKTMCSFLPSPCFCFNQVVRRRDIALKIKEVSERLEVIVKEKDKYGFDLYRATEEPARVGSTTSFVDVSRVRGRDDDQKNLLSMLLSESSTHEAGKIPVISIVGMGGIGKTTLAQLAYNDADVKAQFEMRIWVCVSDPFEETRIARAIVEQLTGATPNLAELEPLCRRISESVAGKRFLLVLDDVWTEDYGKWEPLKLSLKVGASGSRILVTTRKNTVAKMMETAHLFPLGKLSDDECWSLFSQVAFYGRTEEECKRLTDIGKRIAGKCQGLPLAAKTLGGLMQSKRSKEEWKIVLSSELWELEEVERGLFPPLLLSYYDLPAGIRRCFAICGMFPKDHAMERGELIRLWMAQGYLKPTPSKDMEFVGKEYLEILAARAFFQDFAEWDFIRENFKTHDIVHDFAQYLMKNECLVVDVTASEEPRIDSYESIRHLSISLSVAASFPLSICEVKNLRSLQVISKGNLSIGAALSYMFHHLTCLRSLDLSGSAIEEIPSDVEKLIHLRCLHLSYCQNLKALAETVSNLFNLQTLTLDFCESLKKLPQGLVKLSKLRHLGTIGSGVAFLPKGIGGLTSLRTLSQFNVCGNESNAANIGELKNLNHLQGELFIRNLGNVADAREALEPDLKSKTHLIRLILEFSKEEERELCMNEDAVIEALQPPSDLEHLSIDNYGGTSWPTWMTSLTNLRNLEFCGCGNVESVPPLGRLPYLERLEISKSGMRKLDVGLLGIDEHRIATVTAFPKLESLVIKGMEELEEWDGIERRVGWHFLSWMLDHPTTATIMPRLQELTIYNCRKLTALPDYILSSPLQDLYISGCPILHDRYRKGGEDWHKIYHIPAITIDDRIVRIQGKDFKEY